MDELQSSEETAFVKEEIQEQVLEAIQAHLAEQEYDERRVPQWIDAICTRCMYNINRLRKPFKYCGMLMKLMDKFWNCGDYVVEYLWYRSHMRNNPEEWGCSALYDVLLLEQCY